MHDRTVEYENHTLNGEELSPKSLFLSGGVTELLTGISLNILFDEKKLSPDDTITKFYPWLTFNYENTPTEITIRQLASHSSGIPFHTQDRLFGDDYDGKLRTAMHCVSGANLSFLPGTAYRRVQTDYAILAFIMEKVTGMSWSEYVTQSVIKPLGLTNTYISYDTVPETEKVTGGSRTCGLFILNHDIKLNAANVSSKGMITCAEDLIRIVNILSGEISIPDKLEKAVKALLVQEACAFSPEETGSDAFFGGIFFSSEKDAFYMDGAMENFSTSIWFKTIGGTGKTDQGIIVQCSGMKAPADKILENYRKQLEGKDDFLVSFISTETLDIINSFLCIVLLYLCVLNVFAINRPKRKGYSKIRSAIGIILIILYMIATALFPFYLDSTYLILYMESPLMILGFIGLSQVFGILSLCRVLKNRKSARKKAGYMTASGSYL